MKIKKNLALIFSLIPVLIGCIQYVPVKKALPKNEIYYEFVHIPAIVDKNEEKIFSVHTKPGNICFASINYSDSEEVLRLHELTDQTANDEGLCSFVWSFGDDFDIKPGYATFKIVIQEGEKYVYPQPQSFCAIHCQ